MFGSPAPTTPAPGGGLFGAPAGACPLPPPPLFFPRICGSSRLLPSRSPLTALTRAFLLALQLPAADSEPPPPLRVDSNPAPAGGGLFGASTPAPAAGGFGAPASTPAAGGGLFGGSAPASTPAFGAPAAAPATGGGLFGAAAPASTPAAGGGLFGAAAPASTPAIGGGLFGASTPATSGGGLFGASAPASTPAAGGGLFGASAPATAGGLFGASAPATGGGLFGASTPAAGGGLFGASAPATAGGLFGASAPATGGGGLFGASAPATGGGGLFGASAPATGGGGLFGASTPAAGGGLFGASTPATGGGLFGAPAPAAGALVPAGGLAGAQPAGSVLSTTDGQPVKHFTQWGELAPASQENLRALETRIVETREDSKLLDGVARLREGPNGAGAKRRAELERSVSRASDTLKLLETQLWSDNDRLQGLRDAVVSTLRDAEHAQARLQRLKDASAADEAAATHARLHPGQPPPPAAAPVYLPAPTRPSPYLAAAVDRLYATAEGFERGTLEMEHNLRTTGRVRGHGGGGPGVEALAAALDGAAVPGGGSVADVPGMSVEGPPRALGPDAGPAEVRAAVEGARRYFNKVGADLARLHERTRRAKAAHLAALRERGDHRDPFAEAAKAEAEAARLAAMAERPAYAAGPPAGMPGSAVGGSAVGAAPGEGGLALPAPAAGGIVTTPGSVAPAAGGGLFGGASTPAGGGLFGRPRARVHASGGRLVRCSRRRCPRRRSHAAGGSVHPRRCVHGGGLVRCPAAAASTPAAGGGLFGAPAAAASTPAAGGLFGAPAAAASTPAAGGGLFGAPAAAASTPAAGGLFGAPPPLRPRQRRAADSSAPRRRRRRRAADSSVRRRRVGSGRPRPPSVRPPRSRGAGRGGDDDETRRIRRGGQGRVRTNASVSYHQKSRGRARARRRISHRDIISPLVGTACTFHFGCVGWARAALGRENTRTRHFFTVPCPVAARGVVREMRIMGCRELQSRSLSCDKTDSGKKLGRSLSCSRRHAGREPCGILPHFSQVRATCFTTTQGKFHKNRFCMSKQCEAQIGVETSLTVCYSKMTHQSK